jgi:hypothetical protein
MLLNSLSLCQYPPSFSLSISLSLVRPVSGGGGGGGGGGGARIFKKRGSERLWRRMGYSKQKQKREAGCVRLEESERDPPAVRICIEHALDRGWCVLSV